MQRHICAGQRRRLRISTSLHHQKLSSIRYFAGLVLFGGEVRSSGLHYHVFGAVCGLCAQLVAVENDLLEACVLSSLSFVETHSGTPQTLLALCWTGPREPQAISP